MDEFYVKFVESLQSKWSEKYNRPFVGYKWPITVDFSGHLDTGTFTYFHFLSLPFHAGSFVHNMWHVVIFLVLRMLHVCR